MGARSRGRRIGKKLYQNRHSFVAIAKVGQCQIESRFPLDTPRREIRDWQQREEAKLRTARPPRVARGTFDADIVAHLKIYADRPKLQAQQAYYLTWWASQRGDDGRRLGSRRRDSFTAAELRGHLARLAATKIPRGPHKKPGRPTPATVRHYRTALFSLYTNLDGKDAKNPLRDVAPPASEDPEPRWIPYEVLKAIVAAMPDRGQPTRHRKRPKTSKTKARLAVWMETGLPKRQIEQLQPEHVDEASHSVLVKGRKKGKGTKTVRLPVTDAALAALRHFFRIGAGGRFSASSARKCWWRAIHALVDEMAASDYKAARTLLESLRRMHAHPYDLRHSYLTDSYLAGKDIRATQDLAQHSDGRMTRRYTLAAVDRRLADVAQQLASHRGAPTPLPTDREEREGTSSDSG